jgi:hypothetical protein
MTDKPRGDQEAPDQEAVDLDAPIERSSETPETPKVAANAPTELPDPNDEIPVPIVMSPAEVDERAQVVETLREEEGVPIPPEQADEKR